MKPKEKANNIDGYYTVEVIHDYNRGDFGGHTIWHKEKDVKLALKEQAKLYKKEIVCLKSDLCWCIGVLEGMEHLRAKELKQKYCGENK